MNPNENILLFDGVCNLCNNLVNFIIRCDPKAKIKFTPLQSETGHALMQKSALPSGDLFSIVYIQNGKYMQKSTAILHVLKTLGGFWKLFFVFIVLPVGIRDFLYDIIAKHRYNFFGKKDTCMIPNDKIRNRFLY